MLLFDQSSHMMGLLGAHLRLARASGHVLATVAALATVSAATGAAAQSAGQWKSPEQMYGSVCGYCHDTRVGPVIQGRQLSEDIIVSVVTKGLRQMPAFRPTDFSNQELMALAKWLKDSPPPAKPAEVKR
ncbi:cytochrome c [Bradyrhizobium sp. BR 10261]|nr:cytochrome c [Bradyrhizobium sp. BR 10261]